MSRTTMVKTKLSKPLLSLNMRNVNQFILCFKTDLALLHGSHLVSSIATMLWIRTQLSPQLGRLGSYSEIVIVSALFIAKDIKDDEAKRICSQATTRISNLAKENQDITIATCPLHEYNRRNLYLQAFTAGRENVVIAPGQSKYEREVILESRQTLMVGSAELPMETLPLTAFMEV